MPKHTCRVLPLAVALILCAAPVSQLHAQIEASTLGLSTGRANPSSTERGGGVGTVPLDFDKLKLAPGFLVGLTVMDDSDFNGSYRLDQQGNITVPFLGDIHLGGDTLGDARVQIRKVLLDRKLLVDPQVKVEVLEYAAQEVTILGEVAIPGRHPLLGPRNLADVLSLAGGPTNMAADEVTILSATPGAAPVKVHYSRNTDAKDVENVMVHPGDTIQVKRAGLIYILGAVNRPGGFVMHENGSLSLLQAVSMASGTSPLASTNHVYLLRHNDDGTVVRIEVPYKKIAEGKLSDVALHNSDILFFPDSKLKTTLSNSQGIATAAATATIYRVLY